MGLDLASAQIFCDTNVEYLRWKRFHCQYFNDAATANLTGVGTALTNTGTQAGVTQTTTQLNGSKYTTAAVILNSAGVLLDGIHSRSHYIRVAYQITLATITGVRISVGMANTTVANMVGSATPAFSYFGFRFDTGAGDTKWTCYADNASGTPTTIVTTFTPAAGEYLLQMTSDPSVAAVNYYINGSFVGTITATLPATSVVALAPYAGIETLVALTAVNMTVHFINGRTRVGNN